MRISEKTDTRLVIRDNPFLPYLIALIFFVIGVVSLLPEQFLQTRLPVWLSVVLFVVAALIILIVKHSKITIDKFGGTITILWVSVLGKKKTEIMINTVKQIFMREEMQTMRDTKTRAVSTSYSYPLFFVQDNGVQLDFIPNPSSSSHGLFSMTMPGEKNRVIGQKVAEFIGVPFAEDRVPTLREAVDLASQEISKQIEKHSEKNSSQSQ